MAPTWLRPPRDVVVRIESLLAEGRSDTAITKHFSLIEFELSDNQVAEVRREWDQRKDYEERRRRVTAGSPSTPSKLSPNRLTPPASPDHRGGGFAVGCAPRRAQNMAPRRTVTGASFRRAGVWQRAYL